MVLGPLKFERWLLSELQGKRKKIYSPTLSNSLWRPETSLWVLMKIWGCFQLFSPDSRLLQDPSHPCHQHTRNAWGFSAEQNLQGAISKWRQHQVLESSRAWCKPSAYIPALQRQASVPWQARKVTAVCLGPTGTQNTELKKEKNGKFPIATRWWHYWHNWRKIS